MTQHWIPAYSGNDKRYARYNNQIDGYLIVSAKIYIRIKKQAAYSIIKALFLPEKDQILCKKDHIRGMEVISSYPQE